MDSLEKICIVFVYGCAGVLMLAMAYAVIFRGVVA
jgi:hypothetical protein